MLITYKGINVWASAGHYQLVAKKEAILRALPAGWTGNLMGQMRDLDVTIDKLGMLRLCTTPPTLRLLGNQIGRKRRRGHPPVRRGSAGRGRGKESRAGLEDQNCPQPFGAENGLLALRAHVQDHQCLSGASSQRSARNEISDCRVGFHRTPPFAQPGGLGPKPTSCLYRTHHSTLDDEELALYPMETDLGAALAQKPDALIISNPTALHMGVAVPAARQGCALFIEKPLAYRPEDLAELEAALQTGKSPVFSAYQFRFNPGLAKVKQLLDEGAIGRPLSFQSYWGEYLPDWHPLGGLPPELRRPQRPGWGRGADPVPSHGLPALAVSARCARFSPSPAI